MTDPRPAREQFGTPQIVAQLDRILASPPFRTSKRCSDLLRHVVQAACEGNLDYLKERTLGVAVFDRDPGYDTNQDPVVRNTAGQVRKRLAQYYCEPGRDEELRIDLPAGAYIPHIQQPPVRSLEVVQTPVVEALQRFPAERTAPVQRRGTVIGAVAVCLLIGVTVFVVETRHPQTDVNRFWAPTLKQPGPVVLCVGQGHTYKLKGDFDRLFERNSESAEEAPAPARSVPLGDIVPIWDKTIGINDAHTLVRLTALFAGLGRAVEFLGGRSTSLGDLRGRSVVLIGAFNNSWTLSLTGELRFYFGEDAGAKNFLVSDRLHPEMHAWEVRSGQEPDQDYSDYAIVSRVFNPTTEQTVVVAAGIKGGGTAAAGEFLTNAAYLSKALQNAPAHWESRNLQFVLKTRSLSGAAGPPEVVASHYW